jgi:phosphoribosylanthranilate isomerase
MTAIKICGVTRVEDAAAIAAAGADYIGLNLWPRSKRHVTVDQAAELAAAARAAGPVKIVGLFVDAPTTEIQAAIARVAFDVVQLHGNERREDIAALGRAVPIWKALAARPGLSLEWDVDALLLDTPTVGHGGSGTTFDWSIAATARAAHPARRLILAGGLGPDNVARAIAEVSPWGVDVASGVESTPGIKDLDLVAAFIAAARR